MPPSAEVCARIIEAVSGRESLDMMRPSLAQNGSMKQIVAAAVLAHVLVTIAHADERPAEGRKATGSIQDPAVAALVDEARNLAADADYRSAIERYEQAVVAIEADGAPVQIDEAETYYELGQAYLRVPRYDDAIAALESYADVYRQAHADDFISQVPALLRQARTLALASRSIEAAKAYRRIKGGIEKADSRMSLELLPVLWQAAELYRVQAISDGRNGYSVAERSLRRAVHIAENNERTPVRDLAWSRVALADHYTSVDRGTKARKHYRAAWDVLSQDDRYTALRERWFTQTVLLSSDNLAPPLIDLIRAPTTRTPDATLEAIFRIDEVGQAVDIAIVDNEASDDLNRAFYRYVRDLRFRPNLVDGQPSSDKEHSFRIRYAAERVPRDYR